jgi:hypothetical protein
MDLATIIDGADRFVAHVEELTSVIGHADRALPLREYCGAVDGGRSQEHRADGGGDGTGPSFGAVSEALAFRWRRKVVGREQVSRAIGQIIRTSAG